MATQLATKPKKYNTTEVKVKRIDRGIERRMFAAIEAVHHLTPASEAEMENCLVPGSTIVPTRKQTIKENTPGYVAPQPEPTWEPERDKEDDRPDWMDATPPAEACEPA